MNPNAGTLTSKTRDEPWTIGALLDWTARFLGEKGSEFPRLDTELLLAHALECKRIELYTRFNEETTTDQRDRFRQLVRQRVEGCPVAYLIGRKEFFSLEFEVGPEVLIPRPETELLVVECLRLIRALQAPRVLDIGTGSGNLAVAIARHHPGVQMTAVDISPSALAVARRNAAKHGVADRIRFLEGDLCAPLPAGDRFDVVVSNPPYVAEEEIARLHRGVRDYEPHLALSGGPGGFAVFDRLIDQAAAVLESDGVLLLEIGATQEAEVRRRLASQGSYTDLETIRDDSRHPRVLRARRLAR